MRSFFVLLLAVAYAPFAQAKATFPNFVEFQGYSVEQMKAVPDVKPRLGKAMKAKPMQSLVETMLMKNAIFAQAGFVFTTPYLKNYFASRSWYKPGYDPARLQPVDRENARMLGLQLAMLGNDENKRAPSSARLSRTDALKQTVVRMASCTLYGDATTVSFQFEAGGGLSMTVNEFATGSKDGYGYGSGEEGAYGYGDEDFGYGDEEDAFASASYRGKWFVKGDRLYVRSAYTKQMDRSLLIAPQKKICSFN